MKTNLKPLSSSTFKNILMQTRFYNWSHTSKTMLPTLKYIPTCSNINSSKYRKKHSLSVSSNFSSPSTPLHLTVLFLRSEEQLHNPRHGIMTWIMKQKFINGLVLRNIKHGFLLQIYNSRLSKKWIPFVRIKCIITSYHKKNKEFLFC